MTKQSKIYFPFFLDWDECLDELSDADYGRLIRALLAFVRGDEEKPQLNETTEIAYKFMTGVIARHYSKWVIGGEEKEKAEDKERGRERERERDNNNEGGAISPKCVDGGQRIKREKVFKRIDRTADKEEVGNAPQNPKNSAEHISECKEDISNEKEDLRDKKEDLRDKKEDSPINKPQGENFEQRNADSQNGGATTQYFGDFEGNCGDKTTDYGDFTNDSGVSSADAKTAPPTLQQVRGFFKSRQFSSNPDEFFNFYESNGWRVGQNPMANWHASAENFEIKRRRIDSGEIVPSSPYSAYTMFSSRSFSPTPQRKRQGDFDIDEAFRLALERSYADDDDDDEDEDKS